MKFTLDHCCLFGDLTKVNIPGDCPVFNNTTNGNVNLHPDPRSRVTQIPEALLKHVATGALHTSSEVSDAPLCPPGARVAIIHAVYRWATTASESIARIQWIYGTERSGKSTLLRTIAKMLEQHDLLLASFFFSKTANYRNNTTYFIPTIAYQIARSIPTTRPYIERAIDNDPLIFDQSLNTQARALIILPIAQACQRIGKKYQNVIIVDGLNECEGEMKQQAVLRVLNWISEEVPITLAFLIASRSEPHILATFDSELSKPSIRLELKNPDEADLNTRNDEDLCQKCKRHPIYAQLPKPLRPDGVGDLGSRSLHSSSYSSTSDSRPERPGRPPQTSTDDGASTLKRGVVTIDELTTTDIVIAAMGDTGAGRSTFINMASRTQQAAVGHGLNSCTRDVQQISYVDEGRGVRIVLVDTPGFDDTNLTDLEILRRIAEWLKETPVPFLLNGDAPPYSFCRCLGMAEEFYSRESSSSIASRTFGWGVLR